MYVKIQLAQQDKQRDENRTTEKKNDNILKDEDNVSLALDRNLEAEPPSQPQSGINIARNIPASANASLMIPVDAPTDSVSDPIMSLSETLSFNVNQNLDTNKSKAVLRKTLHGMESLGAFKKSRDYLCLSNLTLVRLFTKEQENL
jgi:hypothetical protein